MKHAFCLIIIFLSLCSLGSAVDYESEVHPILKKRCGKCHMDGETKGKLTLDKDKISKEIGNGVIVPGSVKKSDLHWTMTLPPGDDLAMPPKGQRVPKSEIELIAKWIEEGAKLGSNASVTSADSMSDPVDSMNDDTMSDSMGGGMGDPMSDAADSMPPKKKGYKGVFKNYKGMQVPATLIRIDGDRAILRLPDKKEYRYPISMFSEETQKIVSQFKAGTLPLSE